jgi:hypothetical protein
MAYGDALIREVMAKAYLLLEDFCSVSDCAARDERDASTRAP